MSNTFRLGLDQPPTAAAWDDLLIDLCKDGLISSSELFRGIYGQICFLQDLELDVPYAGIQILRFLNKCVQEEVLPSGVFYRLPENLLQCPVPKVDGEEAGEALRDE